MAALVTAAAIDKFTAGVVNTFGNRRCQHDQRKSWDTCSKFATGGVSITLVINLLPVLLTPCNGAPVF
jgi:hypothetical protein